MLSLGLLVVYHIPRPVTVAPVHLPKYTSSPATPLAYSTRDDTHQKVSGLLDHGHSGLDYLHEFIRQLPEWALPPSIFDVRIGYNTTFMTVLTVHRPLRTNEPT